MYKSVFSHTSGSYKTGTSGRFSQQFKYSFILRFFQDTMNPRLSLVDSLTWDEMTSKLEMALCQLQGLVIVCRSSTHASRALTS